MRVKPYVISNVPVMPALSKEDLEIERKVLRKRYDLISQVISKDCLNIKNLKLYKDENEVK